MKLLFDENLSPRLVPALADLFSGSSHIEMLGLKGATDTVVWEYALRENYILISKDNDFRQRAFLRGGPPKVIWLSVGNSSTKNIESILRSNYQNILRFQDQKDVALLVLELPPSID